MSTEDGPTPSAEINAPEISVGTGPALIEGRARDLGGFGVRRVLPAPTHRLVGPFIFFDHMGPAVFQPGKGLDVRPHPHIGLATVTYLFEGEIVHRDSLGFEQPIRPGDINWMTAGRGIVHSERTAPARRTQGSPLHGLQLWVALPRAHEEAAPAFTHYPAAELPQLAIGGARCRVLAGEAYGVRSPVATLSPLFYVEALLPTGAELPLPENHAERAVYVVSGSVVVGDRRVTAGHMLVLPQDVAGGAGGSPALRAEEPSRIALVGGAPIDGERHIFWNFVSSSLERIEQAKRDWRERSFPTVPGDEHEFIPLPD